MSQSPQDNYCFNDIIQDASCVRCGELEETCLHSFRDCEEVATFCRGLGCDNWHGFFLNVDVKEWESLGIRLGGTLFLASLWMLWFNRNKLVFKGESVHVWQQCLSAKHLANSIENVFHSPTRNSRTPLWVGWTTYDSDAFVLNTDGSVIDGKAGFGGIIRFHDGSWCHGFYGSLDQADVIEAELVGIYQGLRLCRQLGIAIVHCQSDSKVAVHWVLEGVAPSHRYGNPVELIRRLLSLPWDASIQHVLREGNGCADILAKKGELRLRV
ncbi:Ribonuclease H domain [Sesbania bispinosa]|nr:Ribonuclease H domain [Sesbania bispinosa]